MITRKKTEKSNENVIWYRSKRVWISIITTFATAFLALFSFASEAKDNLGIDIFSNSNRIVLLILYSTLLALVVAIISITKNYNKTFCGLIDNDSITKIIDNAYDEGRYDEVVKIGYALSNALWYCGRHELRMYIGSKVELAAIEIGDSYVRSQTLIEDLGNGRIEVKQEIDSAIKYIREGIEIAKAHNYIYLLARGHRNLACAYLLQYYQTGLDVKIEKAKSHLDEAKSWCEQIADCKDKLDAEGSYYYAEYKYYSNMKRLADSIQSLIQAKEKYDQLSTYPEHHSLAFDRLIKIQRELGKCYLKDDDPGNNVEGKSLLLKSMEMFAKQNDYSNALRAGNELLKWLFRTNARSPEIRPTINKCQTYANKAENMEYKKEFERLKNDLEGM